ncbi:MAG TPA: aldehyde ferredoxin oxidoreductase family protein [Thermodesulfobacteriota bacterium]|nr:aldehyde ferredoxin oxidoreductase family protein [Thermodesulfobacteriota bacterium]
MYAYAGKILHVDLTAEKFREENLSPERIRKFIGGRGINADILFAATRPGIDPLGEDNVLIFGTGALTGTFAPSSGRMTITAKGPATNLYLKSSVGGHFAPELKFAGYDFLVIRGKAERPVYLWIQDGKASIRDAARLWGKDVQETEHLIEDDLKEDRVEIACIGQAGENLVKFAAIMVGHNSAGRGGLGAVMGAKKLKAVAVRGSRPVEIAQPEGFKNLSLRALNTLAGFEGRKGLSQYGTAGLVPMRNETRLFPVKNFQEGYLEGAYQISGQYLAEKGYLKNRTGCSACGTSCHRFTTIDEGKYAGTKSGGPEYETVAALGAGCKVIDTEAVLKANELCNRYGLDTISAGSVIQWAMECRDKEVLSAEGVNLTWGNGDALVELIRRIAFREDIGDILAEGVKRAAEKVGRDSWKWAVHAKGLEPARAEVRARKGYALAHAVNPRGPDHLCSQVYAEDGATPEARALIKKICGSESYATHVMPEKRGAIVRWHEDCYAATDALGLCTFVTLSRGYLIDPKMMAEFYVRAAGTEMSDEELLLAGHRIVTLEKAFNVREGATRNDDTLAWRFMNEPIAGGPRQGMTTSRKELDMMLDEYYGLHGWDRPTGWPKRETLKRLGLEYIAEELSRLGKLP